MASEVDIANLALANLGDNATVASLDPPEGSAQAEHCARFYPIARDALLESHTWGFATKRAQLAELTSPSSSWTYCYSVPSNMLVAIAVLPPDVVDDYSDNSASQETAVGEYIGQPFVIESLDDGTSVIYTDQEDAVLRYTARITDPTKFSPLFTHALAWSLSSMLAGPIIKGDAGMAEAKRCLQMMNLYLGQAKVSDANQRNIKPKKVVSWIARR